MSGRPEQAVLAVVRLIGDQDVEDPHIRPAFNPVPLRPGG
jgi:hypothetical protein